MRTEIGHPAVPRSLIESIVATYAPRRIILFGSRARGDARPDSDLDLIVEVDDDVPKEALHWRKRSEARRDYWDAVDIIPYRTTRLRDRAGIPGTIARAATREGVVIYERA